MQLRAKLYIGFILTTGATCLLYGVAHWTCPDVLHFAAQLAIALIASGLKVRLPGVLSTLSVSYVFVVQSLIDFSYPETILLAGLASATQCLWKPKRPP